MEKIPEIQVGILSDYSVEFFLEGKYMTPCGNEIEGSWYAETRGDSIVISDGYKTLFLKSGALIQPTKDTNYFTLFDVTMGLNINWERKEKQSFKGTLKLLEVEDEINVINVLSIEDYLTSIISSEMSEGSSKELLKAYAVMSRSWLLTKKNKVRNIESEKKGYQVCFCTEDEYIKWYEREDHLYFDVCADHHCHKYQGIIKSDTKCVSEAVKETEGLVLVYGGEICDVRFSKCCGGVTEVYENVWEPVHHSYLKSVVDQYDDPDSFDLDLTNEKSAKDWILSQPAVFCNTQEQEILSHVLSNCDQEINDFFRWEVSYSQYELSELVKKKLNMDFGLIEDLIPVERGNSGRLIKLKIVGEKQTLTIGKEMEIRKTLSESELYSSAFIIERVFQGNDVFFRLKGAGWGHGVGLCQIGAAVMAEKGYSFEQILKHYFRGAELVKKY